jgi:hypothetical protein
VTKINGLPMTDLVTTVPKEDSGMLTSTSKDSMGVLILLRSLNIFSRKIISIWKDSVSLDERNKINPTLVQTNRKKTHLVLDLVSMMITLSQQALEALEVNNSQTFPP